MQLRRRDGHPVGTDPGVAGERTLDDAADRRTYLFFSAFQPYPGDQPPGTD